MVSLRTRALVLTIVGAATALAAAELRAGTGPVGPDVTVFSLSDIGNYGGSGGIHGYSIGTRSCNRGDAPLNWCDESPGCGQGTTDEDHPVIAQNLYRLRDGRFQQIGMSWLKHGFLSTNSTTAGCSGAQGQSCTGPPLGSSQLGVGCTDPYGSGLNGSRPLGLRSEVNPTTGDYPFPYTEVSGTGPYEQRVKVAETDLDAAQNPGAFYWIEGQYIAPDDAVAENGLNNASYRRVTVGVGPSYALSFAGVTIEGSPAIVAWKKQDPGVDFISLDVPASTPRQRFHVARKTTDLGGGNWHYEYAIHNLNANVSARAFSVDLPGAAITNVGFTDIEHHSGEPYATTDWVPSVSAGTVGWSTDTFLVDPDANALRWATMFNFWFDANVPPSWAFIHQLALFKDPLTTIEFQVPVSIFADGFESGGTSNW